jgi:uncharacterized cupredoxin-like copper-binding protein
VGAVGVHEREFRITLTRGSLPAGRNVVELSNDGEDPHDLRIARDELSQPVASFDTLRPGARASQTINLAPGVYRLWCSLPGHDAAGMHTTLTVVG